MKEYLNQHQGTVFPTNKVTTTRFNIFNFLPITILLQFTKVINVFYLGNAILQSFPSVSTNDPLFTIIPLSILIFLGVLKEGLADYKRYKIDKTTNAAPVHRLTGRTIPSKTNKFLNRSRTDINFTREASKDAGMFTGSSGLKQSSNKVASLVEEESLKGVVEYEVEVCRTEQLMVGDIIRVDDDCAVPADCFLLASEKNRMITEDGSCFISTESLNGERALDPKMAIREVLTNLEEIVCGGGQRQLMELQCT